MATVQSLFLAGSNFSFLYASHFLLSVFPLLALFAARSLHIIQPHLDVCVCVGSVSNSSNQISAKVYLHKSVISLNCTHSH